jgi:hypothetical protein
MLKKTRNLFQWYDSLSFWLKTFILSYGAKWFVTKINIYFSLTFKFYLKDQQKNTTRNVSIPYMTTHQELIWFNLSAKTIIKYILDHIITDFNERAFFIFTSGPFIDAFFFKRNAFYWMKLTLYTIIFKYFEAIIDSFQISIESPGQDFEIFQI